MSKLTGIKNTKQLIKKYEANGKAKGLFKELKAQCAALQLSKQGGTMELAVRLMQWIETTKTKSLKTAAVKEQNKPLLEKIIAKSKDSEAINAAKNELKSYGLKSDLNQKIESITVEIEDFEKLIQSLPKNDTDLNELNGHLTILLFERKSLKDQLKDAGNVKLQAAKHRKEKLLAKMRKRTLSSPINSIVKAPIESVAIEINTIKEVATEIEETEEDSIEIVYRKKKALIDSNGQLIKAVLRNSKTGWEWQLLNEEGKASGETIGTDKARQNSELALYDVTESVIEAPGTMIEYQDRDTGEWRKRFKRNCLFPINSIVTNHKTLLLKTAIGNDSNSIKKETNPMRKLPSRTAAAAPAKKSLKQLMKRTKTVAPAIEEDSSDPFADYEEEEAAAPAASRRLPGRKAKPAAAKPAAAAAAAAATVDNSKELNELKAMIKAQSISISALVQSVNKLNETINTQTYSIAALKEAIETVEEESEATDEVEETIEAVKPAKKKAAAKKQGGLSDAAAAAVELAQLVYDDETDEAVTFTIGMLCEFRGMELRSAGPVKRSLNGLIKSGQIEAYDMGEVDAKGNEVLEYGLPGLAD